MLNGQWEPRLILHACPITEQGKRSLNDEQLLCALNSIEEEGGGAGLAGIWPRSVFL